MFERYTEKARRTIFFARYEASEVGSPYIESEHLLLGLVREGVDRVPQIKRELSTAIRRKVEEIWHSDGRLGTSVDLPLSNESKRILAYAGEEADRREDKHIGTEHLLLGILREKECKAAEMLRDLGFDIAGVRRACEQSWKIVPQPQEPEAEPVPWRAQGIPPGFAAPRLLYNAPAETLILQLTARRGPMKRLFYRHKDANDYDSFPALAESISYEDPVTCESEPLVFFQTQHLTPQPDNRWAGNPVGVYWFNLATKQLHHCKALDALEPLEEGHRVWISSLIAVSADARILRVNLAMQSPSFSAKYWLAEVDVTDGSTKLLTQLIDVFF